MAAISGVSRIGHRIPVGDRFLQTVTFIPVGVDSGTEWVAKNDISFSTIDQVMSSTIVNTAFVAAPGATYTAPEQGILDDARPVQFQLNAKGTAAAAGSSPGDLGIRFGRIIFLQVTVLGR